MRFLVDESMSARVAQLLAGEGHDAVHVGDLNLLGAVDTDVMEAARHGDRILLSVDTDFGELLALGNHSTHPSAAHDVGGTASRPFVERWAQRVQGRTRKTRRARPDELFVGAGAA